MVSEKFKSSNEVFFLFYSHGHNTWVCSCQQFWTHRQHRHSPCRFSGSPGSTDTLQLSFASCSIDVLDSTTVCPSSAMPTILRLKNYMTCWLAMKATWNALRFPVQFCAPQCSLQIISSVPPPQHRLFCKSTLKS
jgi:hypothetical protein